MQQFPTIRLAIPTRIAAPFDDPAWVFELKHDGFRALASIGDRRCDLISRKNNVYKSFAALCAELAGLPVKNAVLDGEIVVLDGEGRSQFNQLLHRRGQPAFYAFELLFLNNQDLRQLPLIQRKARLRKLIEKSRCPVILYAQHVEEHGTGLYREICRRDLEGIICKRKRSEYSATAGWLKVMNPNYTQHEGRHEMFTTFHKKSQRQTAATDAGG